MWKAGTQLQHLTQLQLAREFHHIEPIMLKNLQSFCNSWDKDILAHHGRSWDLASKRADPPTS